MRRRFLVVMIISIALVMGAAKLHAQAEFIDQMGIGFGYGFVEDKDYSGANFNIDYLLGVHVHNWNTAILAGIRTNLDNLDVGGQVEHFFGFLNSRRLTGFGASLAGGVQLFSDDGVVPYIRAGGFWHFATMILVGLEFDYRFNGQCSAGITLSLPSATMFSRLESYKRIYVEKKPKKEETKELYFLIIQNKLLVPITHLYVSPAGEDAWRDILKGKSIPPGEASRFSEFFRIKYDVRVEDADGNIYTYLNEDFSGADGSAGKMFVIDSKKADK